MLGQQHITGLHTILEKDAGGITIQNDKLKKNNLQLVISPNTIHHSPHFSGKIAKQNL